MEPDEDIRAKYFKECDGKCRPWIVPAHHNDHAAAKEIGYKLYKIDRCPAHTIWRSTRALFHHPIFSAAIRYRKMPVSSGGVMKQPVTMGHLIHFARTEIEWFNHLVAQRETLKKRK